MEQDRAEVELTIQIGAETEGEALAVLTVARKRPAQPAKPKSSVPKDGGCEVCGATPTVADTGLCGPCCFGEAETAGGNW